MTPINKNDFFAIGYILKPHGLKGEMILELSEGYEETLEEAEYLMVEVEGGLVPFFLTGDGIRFRTATAATITLDGIDTAEKVRKYVGCKIYLHHETAYEPDDDTDFEVLLGYLVFDQEKGLLGEVIHVDDFSGNIVLTVLYKSKELLLPFSEALVVSFDEARRELHLDCPDGLIDLYLE